MKYWTLSIHILNLIVKFKYFVNILIYICVLILIPLNKYIRLIEDMLECIHDKNKLY